jgi:uncharacterized membrane-anchored protein YhcB (DUF1043 family)
MRKSNKKSFNVFILGLIIGMVVMFLLDMIFYFNNSVETQLKREMDKAKNKVENLFK